MTTQVDPNRADSSKPSPEQTSVATKSIPLGQSVDCDVCIAKAGHPCFMQPEVGEARYGSLYVPGDAYWPERWHIGARTKAKTTVTTAAKKSREEA